VTATNTATTTGSPHSSARLTQLLGRRTSFTSSTLITAVTTLLDAVGSGAGDGQHEILQ